MEILIYVISEVTPYYGVFWFVIVSPIIWLFWAVSLIKSQLFLMNLDLSFAKPSFLDHLHLELILSQTLIAWWLGTKTWRIYLVILSRNLSFSQIPICCLWYYQWFFKSSPFHPKVRQEKASKCHVDSRGRDVLPSWANVFIMWLNVCFWAKSPLLWFMAALLYSFWVHKNEIIGCFVPGLLHSVKCPILQVNLNCHEQWVFLHC